MMKLKPNLSAKILPVYICLKEPCIRLLIITAVVW
jgi:hypothetical protein